MNTKEIKRTLESDINIISSKYPESTVNISNSISSGSHNPNSKIHHNY